MNPYRTASQFIRFAVVRLIIRRLPITHHSHNVGESDTGAIVLVSVKEDTQTLESIRRSKDRALRCALLGEPQREAIPVEVSGTVNLKLDLDLLDLSITPNPYPKSIHSSRQRRAT